jgi:hypothetical protein
MQMWQTHKNDQYDNKQITSLWYISAATLASCIPPLGAPGDVASILRPPHHGDRGSSCRESVSLLRHVTYALCGLLTVRHAQVWAIPSPDFLAASREMFDPGARFLTETFVREANLVANINGVARWAEGKGSTNSAGMRLPHDCSLVVSTGVGLPLGRSYVPTELGPRPYIEFVIDAR